MQIVMLGAGVQGTLYGVRLARAGHDITLVARGARAAQLRERGAIIEHASTAAQDFLELPVVERLSPDVDVDVCIVTTRREQIFETLALLEALHKIKRLVYMVNHANGSDAIYQALGRSRVVLAFPGAAGSIENGVDRYLEIPEQPTVVQADARDIIALLRSAEFKVEAVRDMDGWLRRHAVFVTAIAGALYESAIDPQKLSESFDGVITFIRAVREGWWALDRRGIGPAPIALRAIFCWVPSLFAVRYWRRLLSSERGDIYFARHSRHAVAEMAALAADVRLLLGDTPTPHLNRLYSAIDCMALTTHAT